MQCSQWVVSSSSTPDSPTPDSGIDYLCTSIAYSQPQTVQGVLGAEPPSFSIQFRGFGFSESGIRCFSVQCVEESRVDQTAVDESGVKPHNQHHSVTWCNAECSSVLTTARLYTLLLHDQNHMQLIYSLAAVLYIHLCHYYNSFTLKFQSLNLTLSYHKGFSSFKFSNFDNKS